MNIRTDGPITSGTKKNLITGVHSSPMPINAVEGVRIFFTKDKQRVIDLINDASQIFIWEIFNLLF